VFVIIKNGEIVGTKLDCTIPLRFWW